MIYLLMRIVFTPYLRLFHRVEVKGREHIPATGPAILCANHTSYLDSMLVGYCTLRPVRFMITRSFYRHAILGFFIKGCGAIPVSQGGVDKEAFRLAREALGRGELLGIFPEGRLSRSGLPGEGKPGAALLATMTGVPIVPITISGAFFVYPKGKLLPRPGRITVKVHPPLAIARQNGRDKAHLQEITDRVMGRIERSLHPALRAHRRRRRILGRRLPFTSPPRS
ncbi:MAG TPA: lysophospholipid acyltransferase family protein [Desulfuromonadaceae bacterium]